MGSAAISGLVRCRKRRTLTVFPALRFNSQLVSDERGRAVTEMKNKQESGNEILLHAAVLRSDHAPFEVS